MFFGSDFKAPGFTVLSLKARGSSCWRIQLGAEWEVGKIWAVPNPSGRLDDMGSAFTSLRLEESRPSSLGARPEVEVEVQREDKTGQGQELDRTRESRVVAALQVTSLWSLPRCGLGCWP